MILKKTRWEQRFENFDHAFNLLSGVFIAKTADQFTELEKEGIVQRFEYTFELAWKTLKDYLEYTGTQLQQVTPREVIKVAFAAKIIQEGETWIKMLEHRNLMSHTYSQITFEKAVKAISTVYLPAIKQLFEFLKVKVMAL